MKSSTFEPGTGNSPVMYLGHAAGQLKLVKCHERASLQPKNFVPFINNNNRIQYNYRMSLNC